MNMKRIIPKLVGGLLAAAFVVTAVAGTTKPAAASPCTNPIECPAPRPDLVVKFNFATCHWYVGESSPHYELKLTVINMANTPAMVDFYTDVTVDGVEAPGSPHKMLAPLWTTEVFHVKGTATPGWHVAKALTDSTFLITESNETNNGAVTRFSCPASAS